MGDSAFYNKLKIEMRVLLDYFHRNFPIPQKFKTMTYWTRRIKYPVSAGANWFFINLGDV